MSISNWEHFFKPESRSSGAALLSKDKVAVSQPSDTEIIIYIRASSGFKVSFKTNSVGSDTLIVDCNCPVGKKGQLCKHVWAGLLATEEKNSDFFECIKKIEKKETVTKTTETTKPTERSQAFAARQAEFKAKQDVYRKEQYQKQKQRQKDFKQSKKNAPVEPEYSYDVQRALNFFSENGFDLKDTLNKESVTSSKKKLARVFHPDVGGSHEEILELNKHAEALIKFIDRK